MLPFLTQGVPCNTLALNLFSTEYIEPFPLLVNGKSKQYLMKNSDFICDSTQYCSAIDEQHLNKSHSFLPLWFYFEIFARFNSDELSVKN